MRIKRRHIKMARAAWRSPKVWMAGWVGPNAYDMWVTFERWHRAAKGKHQ